MGKKIALCVGINSYPQNSLQGCVNDAGVWAGELSRRGYRVTSLLNTEATGVNIRAKLAELTESLRFGDKLVFTYSGHGTYGHDASGDEYDDRDEAICPVDCFTKGMLYDDELQVILGSRRYGSRVLMVMDSCHSGTVNKFLETDTLSPVLTERRIRFIPPGELPFRVNPVDRVKAPAFKTITLLSGCKDDEYSYDAYINQGYTGAFTYYAIKALREGNPKTLNSWSKKIKAFLPSTTYPQSPQLSGTVYQRSRPPLP